MVELDTRRRILDVALTCFLSESYERATITRIRRRSGVSNGALFHHFASKQAIADALYVEAMASFQRGLWELVEEKPRTLREAVGGTIAHQLQWTEQHPDLARFVYLRGPLEPGTAGAAELAALNRELAAAFRAWMAPFLVRGEIRPVSMLTITAIVGGPAHAIARRWLAGQLEGPLSAFVDELADAAWAGLRGQPARTGRREVEPASTARTAAAEPAAAGRVTLELITAGGEVIARGHGAARLHAVADPDPTIETSGF